MTILAIGAHPDDIEFGCGGTLRLAHEAGHRVVHVVITSGEEGGLKSEGLADAREKEALASAAALGVEEVHFLHEPDGLTSYQKETKVALIRLIRQIRPERVFIHSTTDLFPDHAVVSRLSRDAVLAAAGPWYPEGGSENFSVKEILGFEVWHPIPSPAVFVDVTTTMDAKIAALRCHQSQIASIDYVGAVEGLARYRAALSMKAGFVEAFELLRGEIIL